MNDDLLTVETPERVELQFTIASIGTRFLACAIDHLIQMVGIAAIIILTELNLFTLAFGEWAEVVSIIAVFVIFFGYFIVFEALGNGQTPGKRWFGLRVIRFDGRPLDFFSAMARNLMRLADIIPFGYSVGLVAVFASRHSRRLGDYVANTVVVAERGSDVATYESLFTGEEADAALCRQAPIVDFDGDITAVTPAEILAVETFLRRRDQIPVSPRLWLAWRVATPLLEKIRPRFDPVSFSYEGFLEELIARDRSRHRHHAG